MAEAKYFMRPLESGAGTAAAVGEAGSFPYSPPPRSASTRALISGGMVSISGQPRV